MHVSLPVVGRATVVVALLSCLAAGCGSDPVLDPAVELGGGETAFESLLGGDVILVVQGSQGGYHLYGSMIAQGIEAGVRTDLGSPLNPTTIFRAYRGATQIDSMFSEYTQGLRRGPSAGTYEMIGREVRLDIASDAELDGVDVRLEVEITDVNGVVVRDERTLLARPHPANR